MSLVSFTFNEVSPASAGGAASSLPVENAGSIFPVGQAGPFDLVGAVEVLANLVGATGGPLDVYLQSSQDEGATWRDQIHFPQLLAAASAVSYHAVLSDHPQATSDTVTVIGINSTPVLAAGKIVQGTGFNRLRLYMVAGTSTSAGAVVQVTVSGKTCSHC
jgi:hypothetical protein